MYLKARLLLLNIEFYGWKLRRDYNVVPKWFSRYQLPPSMANSSDTDLKKEASLKQNQKSPQIMSPVDRNPEEKINACDTSNESEWESDFSTDSSDNDPLEIEFSP